MTKILNGYVIAPIALLIGAVGLSVMFIAGGVSLELGGRILIGALGLSVISGSVLFTSNQLDARDLVRKQERERRDAAITGARAKAAEDEEKNRMARMVVRMRILEAAKGIKVDASAIEQLEVMLEKAEQELSGDVARLVDDSEREK